MKDDLSRQLVDLMGPNKYVLLVQCEHADPHVMTIPLMLDGGEDIERAISRFKDAIAVSKNGMCEHHGRDLIGADRIDGLPSVEMQTAHDQMRSVLRGGHNA